MPPVELPSFPEKACRPEYTSSRKKHVPRPPNAFMLFRSIMINPQIPKIENRQQNVSRIAGEIWNKLDEDVKQAWHAKAEEVQREHRLKYPNYKFAPSRKALKLQEEEDGEARNMKDYIRHLREKYMGVMGPAVAPIRKRKSKSCKTKVEEEDMKPVLKNICARLATFDPIPSSSQMLPPMPTIPPLNPVPSASTVPPWRIPAPSYAAMQPVLPDPFSWTEFAKVPKAAYFADSLPQETIVPDRSACLQKEYIPYIDNVKVRRVMLLYYFTFLHDMC